jgi:uncharacterized protein (TIGR02588 family)
MATPKANAQRKRIPLSEWIVASIGAVLVLASIAILIHGVVTSTDSPPVLRVRVASIERAGGQYLVMIEVGNQGGATAAEARIEAELRQQGAVVERSETTVDYIPRNSIRRAGLLFDRDPGAHELTLRASGYREP